MNRSALFIATVTACSIFASAAMAASASNISSGGEAGSSGLGAEQTPKMNGNDPAATGTTPGGAMMQQAAPMGDANKSDAMGATGAMKDSSAAMKNTTGQ